MHLGMYHFAADEKDRPEPDLRIARHTIDLLAMLQEKTRGNVTLEEQRLLENSLTELRFRFVQAMERKKPAASEATPHFQTKEADTQTKEADTQTKEEQAGG